MEIKDKYLEKTEIKVKNLLSELYEYESEVQKEKMKIKEKLSYTIEVLEKEYKQLTQKRKELQEKFEKLKAVGDNEFEVLLNYIEGDKESFIDKAESLINELGDKIQELEDNAVDTAVDVKIDLAKKTNELKNTKKELQEKLEIIKSDTDDRWRDIKHWFIDKSKSVKEYIASV